MAVTTDYGAQLAHFAQALEGESFASRLVPETADGPATLLVALAMEGHPQGGLQLELSFLPAMESQLAGLSLLQCFVAIAGVTHEGKPELRRALASINRFSPINGFGLLEHQGILYFRHTLMLLPGQQLNVPLVIQTAWLISYLLELFGPGLSQLAGQGGSLEDAFKGHEFAHLILGDLA
ncbi:type III secretion system chaperone family protein [Cellvibrio japonicus]|uniref:Uncharacterized protein n=1 Tax=Cellvibrio japonicus (strain Ueda107) TaxID=498211 RepID=B3PBP9_CELJU|nr:hypothetical protein [Cellvibrio japonicus]ACE83489.1 hypothetical protein CJA_1113 [Cellvibrio japonicus Ueda107]QEI11721.1 hypothetical protein FY117_05405 [Cellvibrio japonicus]QEI15295.1 hypothetical protein FY116_05405 [Cellvibrio japonicus]QEI18875.1 hypothetical protein FY115_05405 [Cellvibrio japonicus]